MKISKEVRVGVVAILSIALLVWGYNFLKGTNLLFKSKKTCFTEQLADLKKNRML